MNKICLLIFLGKRGDVLIRVLVTSPQSPSALCTSAPNFSWHPKCISRAPQVYLTNAWNVGFFHDLIFFYVWAPKNHFRLQYVYINLNDMMWTKFFECFEWLIMINFVFLWAPRNKLCINYNIRIILTRPWTFS